MELPNPQPELEKIDESDESAESNSSESEAEEDEDDSGMDESVEGHSESDSENSESDSEIARDFCIHQKVCTSVAECVIYEGRLVEEKKRLRVKLKDMKAGCKALTEKRRALSIIKQTIHVESKIEELERILGWMYKAREKMSTPMKPAAEIKHAPEDGRQTTEKPESLEATVSPVNEG